jgi:lysophospholipase L1-like esterase
MHVRRMRRLLTVSFVAVATMMMARLGASAAEAPNNIAAIGDSITRATDACCWYGDHPSYSWSTGFNPLDGLHSHYERLVELQPSIWGDEYNDARAGAKMADGPAQAAAAVAQGADYVTILLGANDVCTSSADTMTPVPDFAASFRSTMATLEVGLPSTTRIFVASIPNVRRLWRLFHQDATARYIWRTYHVCQSLLGTDATLDDRRHVYNRTLRFNEILGDVCSRYANCRYDGGAVFDYAFGADEVSDLDYFHPNLTGQNALAGVTWAASWWN